MASPSMSARLLLVGNGAEGTGPALSLSVVRLAAYSQEETPLLQVVPLSRGGTSCLGGTALCLSALLFGRCW